MSRDMFAAPSITGAPRQGVSSEQSSQCTRGYILLQGRRRFPQGCFILRFSVDICSHVLDVSHLPSVVGAGHPPSDAENETALAIPPSLESDGPLADYLWAGNLPACWVQGERLGSAERRSSKSFQAEWFSFSSWLTRSRSHTADDFGSSSGTVRGMRKGATRGGDAGGGAASAVVRDGAPWAGGAARTGGARLAARARRPGAGSRRGGTPARGRRSPSAPGARRAAWRYPPGSRGATASSRAGIRSGAARPRPDSPGSSPSSRPAARFATRLGLGRAGSRGEPSGPPPARRPGPRVAARPPAARPAAGPTGASAGP